MPALRLAFWAAIAAGLVLRLLVDLPGGLWEDEIIAATHAVQPLGRLLVNVLRNDIHPPLYFVQLHLWALAGRSDGWLIANSVLWGVAAVLSLGLALRARGRAGLGLAAAAVLALWPSALWMSQELRPYAFFCTLNVWAYYFACRCFEDEAPRRADRVALLLLALALVGTHAIGFVAPFLLAVNSGVALASRRAPGRRWAEWALIYGVAGLAAVPILVTNLLHDANLGALTGLAQVVPWFSQVVTSSDRGGAVYLGGLILYAAIAVGGLALARTRRLTLCFVILPMLLAVAAGLAGKTMFKANIFCTLIAPYAAIVLAELILGLPAGRRRAVPAALVLAAVGALGVASWHHRHTESGYLEAATLIRAEARPGDVVYMPQMSHFWGMVWYLAGPDWTSPLRVAAPPSARWRGVYAKLGPTLVERLHLVPATQSLGAPGGLTLLTGPDSLDQAARAPRLWLVARPRADLPPSFPPKAIGALRPQPPRSVRALTLTEYVRGA